MHRSEHLLVCALRACLGQPDRWIASPPEGAEWDELAALAVETGLSHQVLHAAGTTRAAALPSAVLKAKGSCARHTVVRNALQEQRLKQLVDACASEGIPVVLVKGLWLVHCVYRDVAARESGDLDLLFRPHDVGRFTAVARALGFEVPADGASLSDRAGSTNEFALRHPDTGLLVDVHWALTNPASEEPVDEALLWERSQEVDIGGVRCRTLNLEDHLLYLCFHAAGHHKFWAVGPRSLYDVAMVIRQPPRAIRWDELAARAHALGWQRAAWLMFSLVEEHLGVQVPAGVMQALHRETPADALVRRLALEAIFAAREQESLYRHMARMLAPRSGGGRLKDLRQLLLPSRVQMTNQYGVSAGIPTWRLHVKRWRLKLRDGAPEVVALLTGSRAHRAELARTRQIERWLATRA
jgi:hypothetical protein